jgi:hypothetical protein
MAKGKNSYQKAAAKKVLSGTADGATGEKVKDAATELGKDIVVGVIGGGVAGAVLGRLSFVVGAAVTGVGHYAKNRIASALGLGMMASGTYQSMSGMNGNDQTVLEGVKERLMALKDDMKKRVFLDKVLKAKEPKTEEKATNGVGEVQYFVHPNAEEPVGEVDMSELDKIHQQIQDNAMKYNNVNGITAESEMGEIDLSEKNY